MAVLVSKKGALIGAVYPIDGPAFVLGRQEDCELHDAFVGNTGVSRKHAKIINDGGRFFIEDLGSRNGTYLNNVRLTQRMELTDGDKLRICRTDFEFFRRSTFELLHGQKEREPELSKRDRSPLQSVMISPHGSNVKSSIAIAKKAGESDSILSRHAARKFQSLVRLLSNIGKTLDTDTMLDRLLEGLFDIFPSTDRGVIALHEEGKGDIEPRAVRYRQPGEQDEIKISRTLANQAMNAQEAVLSDDALYDQRFELSSSIVSANIRSLMCVPLIDRGGKSLGIIQLDTVDRRGQFQKHDLEVLASITPHAGTALDYARMHAEDLQRQKLQRDLQLAHKVQSTLLPHEPPRLDGYEFFAYYEPAYEVSGDFYGYARLPDEKLAVVIADVVGKGVPAALLMAKLAGEWKFLLSIEETPAAAVARMNDSLCATNQFGQFVTLALAIIDARTHKVTLLNAGHPYPLIRKVNGLVLEVGLDSGGTALGMFPDERYEPLVVELDPGDLMLMYTDGLNEATREDDTIYGRDRLRQQISCGPAECEEMSQHVLGDIQSFVDGHPQSDDMCLTCFRRM